VTNRLGRSFKPRDLLDRAFEISIIAKGLDGALEMIGGLLLLILTPATINSLLVTLTQHELSQDPHDFIAAHALHYARGLDRGTVVSARSISCLTASSTLSWSPRCCATRSGPTPGCWHF
jgi:uncharacterized membrane protein